MERLYQVMLLLVPLICFTFGVSATFGEDTCSLAVRVLSPHGQRIEAPITVREQNGRTINKEQEDEDVYFCDLGILPVEVKVGSDGMCSQTSIHDVPIFADRSYLLTVTYDPEACPEVLPEPVPICTTMFRISDGHDKWVPGAHISIVTPTKSEMNTDAYGRAQFVAKTGTKVQGLVEANGFRERKFSFECSQSERQREERIRLTPR